MHRLVQTLLASAFANIHGRPDGNRRHHTSRNINRGPRRPYPGTSPHPIRTELRQNRAANAARNFYTGHWQHRTVDASAS